MFERDVVILDYTTRDKWPKDVQDEIEKSLKNMEYGQDSMLRVSWMPDESDDSLGWDDKGIPQNSPVYNWLTENNVNINKCYLHIWW